MSESPVESAKSSKNRLQSKTPHSNFVDRMIPSTRLPDNQNTRAPRQAGRSLKSLADADVQPTVPPLLPDGYDPQHHQTKPRDQSNDHRLEESSQREAHSDQSLRQADDYKTWSTTLMYLEDPQAAKSNETTTSQLVSWVYETSNSELAMSEMLERTKWDPKLRKRGSYF
ncbi:uncharacterized protein PAC_12413 [Phialocephala subalpina]|uniref:Uncharacterized protein n=1 Tax=Phialocephala subalpina TaxID=576137 RepID=A0A1L7XBY6_9HELO|nr:uncharacterized protein PAC_12413 [Phialocephala subalpina]